MKGVYGMTQGAMAIQVNSLEEAINISKAISSDKFNTILKSCLFGNYRIDWNIFTYFKKDFWRDFV